MTLNYQDKVPPVDVDHIDYAIKRANLAVRRVMLKEPTDINIVSMKAVGPLLTLRLKRLVDPYLPVEEVDEDDDTQWVVGNRHHRRFSIQEVFDDLFKDGLNVTELTVEGVLAALETQEIGVDEDDIDVKIIGTSAHVTSTNAHSFLWWGQGHVELTALVAGQL